MDIVLPACYTFQIAEAIKTMPEGCWMGRSRQELDGSGKLPRPIYELLCRSLEESLGCGTLPSNLNALFGKQTLIVPLKREDLAPQSEVSFQRSVVGG